VEAVPATSGVRRTVRLAGALVVGQVLLVAVIGWVTFTCAGGHSAKGAPAVDQLAAPPAVIPPPAPGQAPPPSPSQAPPLSPSPAASATESAAAGAQTRTADPDPPAAPRSNASGPRPRMIAPSASAAPSAPVPPAPPYSTVASPGSSSPPPTLVSSSDAPASTPPGSPAPPIQAGQPCTEMFAVAMTADGRLVRCLPTRYHELRWKIV
jgi:hypothetical protein